MSRHEMHPPVSAAEVVRAAGGTTAVANALRINRRAPWQWTVKDAIPPGRVLVMEQLSGYSRHQIRPDLYGPMPQTPKAKRAA